jgi:myo-inositol-1(or 4)-monophosphatase
MLHRDRRWRRIPGQQSEQGHMEHDLPALAKIAINLASEAGGLLSDGHNTAKTAVTHTKSSSVDVVTAVDQASEELIVGELRRQRPEDSVLGEEGASVAGTSGVRWVIDPLDGTVNFVYGIPNFAVSIGVEVDGRGCIGVVYNPIANEMFTAIEGQGAFLNDEPIKVNPSPRLSQALIATGFSYEQEARKQQGQVILELLPQIRDLRRRGSAALDLCAVASGLVDGYFEANVKPWDVCAGEVIAREAGARVTSFHGKRPETDVIAAHPALQSELRRLVVK